MLASLNHPGIAAIYGIEEADDTRALVLELVEGPTLADRIAQGPIPVDEALPIAKQIAEALEAAHEQGVIHRDLKPANIKVKDDGTVKVLDFWLAKALDTTPEGDPSQSPTLTAAATQMGVIMGTAAYMSPEQARGKPVDKRADIWAFGAVLYEMLSGRRAFEGEDVSVTLAEVIKSDPDINALPSDVPARVPNVLRVCLQKDPRERGGDVAAIRLALEGTFETSVPFEHTVLAVGSARMKPLTTALAVLLSIGVGGLAVWSITRPANPRVARLTIPLAPDQDFVFIGRPVVAVAPDGYHVVYQANSSLWLRPIGQLQATQLPGTEEASGPFFSADGRSIGFWTLGQFKKVAVSGGTPVTIADVPGDPNGASWGANDTILYADVDRGIMQVSGSGGTPELVVPAQEGEVIHRPQMLPGGEWVLFSTRTRDGTWDEGQIVAQSVRTGDRTVLVVGGHSGRYLSTGHLVYLLENALYGASFDVKARQLTGGSVPLVEGIEAAGPRGAAQFDVSSTGSLVYVPGALAGNRVFTLVWVDRHGNEETIPAQAGNFEHPRVSPDATRVAVKRTVDGNADIWAWDLNRESFTQLTFDEAIDEFPLWTTDSTRVVFWSGRDGGGLFWRAADGTGQVEQLMEGRGRPSAWAPDGRLIIDGIDSGDIGLLSVDGEHGLEMLLVDEEAIERSPSLSADGRWLVYHSNGVWVTPFPNTDEGRWNPSLGYGRNAMWARDGRSLFYVNLPPNYELMVARVETEPTFSSRTPEPLFRLNPYEAVGRGRQLDLAPERAVSLAQNRSRCGTK